MKDYIVSFITFVLVFLPSLSLASSSVQFKSQSEEIHALNSLSGCKALLVNSGGKCVRSCPQYLKTPDECRETCDEEDAADSGSGSNIEISDIGLALGGVSIVVFVIWLLLPDK